MANFCKKCGRPLENGRCPVCDPVSNNPYAQPAPPVDFNQGSGSAFLGGLEQDFRSLSQSRDVFRLIPAAAFGGTNSPAADHRKDASHVPESDLPL